MEMKIFTFPNQKLLRFFLSAQMLQSVFSVTHLVFHMHEIQQPMDKMLDNGVSHREIWFL